MVNVMKTRVLPQVPRNAHKISGKTFSKQSAHQDSGTAPNFFRREVRVICLYPNLNAGKTARLWIERTMRDAGGGEEPVVEYFNYSLLTRDLIAWNEVLERIDPDVVLMVGEGSHPLVAGMRNSLRGLLTHRHNGKNPLVIFRELEPAPDLNTRVLLDYVSALAHRNHCELHAMDGNGSPISCFRHSQHLLKGRRHLE